MKVNRGLIGERLAEQRERDVEERGAQPSIVFGCFYNLGVNNTEARCEKCTHFRSTCRDYLRAAEIVVDFNEEQRKLYARITREASPN